MNVIKRLIGLCAMMLVLTCCKNENLIDLPVLSKDLVVHENYMIPAACKDPITYTSANEFAVQVSETGKVTARHYTGKEIEILLTSKDDTKSFIVNVTPRSTLYNDPDIIIGQMRGTLNLNPNALVYSDDEKEFYVMGGDASYLLVSYNTNSHRVEYYAVLVFREWKEKLKVFLEDRYEYIATDNGIIYYRDALTPENANKLVAIDNYAYNEMEYCVAIYTSYPHGKDNANILMLNLKKQLLELTNKISII
jgi:hypothetical protein